MKCDHCDKSLRRAQWAHGKAWKSCPNCSTQNGHEHVYYSYPDAFGTTPARANYKNPEGPASWLVSSTFGTVALSSWQARTCSEVVR
jgi:hypothetical protein